MAATQTLLSNEPLVRLTVFAGIFAAMAAWEILARRREQRIGRGTRWPSNIAVVALDAVLVRLVFPTTAIGLALLAETRGFDSFTPSACRVGSPFRLRSFYSISPSTCSTSSFTRSRPSGGCIGCIMPISSST